MLFPPGNGFGMIDFLQGTLVSKTPSAAVVKVRDIGYEVLIPLSTYEALPASGEDLRLLTHLYVREDRMCLYGFARAEERELFRMLLEVNGIGPRMALKVLSSMSVQDFVRFVVTRDVEALSMLVKGVGRKIAQRIVLELHAAIEGIESAQLEAAGGRPTTDAVKVLMSLGESRASAEKLVRAALKELGPRAASEELVRKALLP